ncbi:MAG: hypothetical protein K2M95_01815 [Clostridiales bacterium]|nr:hypothetical protein [Clostridiales bacterium]
MKVYQIEISDSLNDVLEEVARKADMSIESFIGEILNRYAIDPHIMEQDEVNTGYEHMGELHLKISNNE